MTPSAPSHAPSTAIPEHCYYCFMVIEHELNSNSEPKPSPPFNDDDQEYPLFVTWNIFPHSSTRKSILSSPSSRPTPRLRGCIGTFEPYPLAHGLAEYASISAFKDRRFSPISQVELSRLECGVSLLTEFEDCQDYLDWQVGVHGIYIHLPNPALAPKPLLARGNEDSASSSSGSGASTPAPAAKKTRLSRSSSSEPTFLTATYLPDVIPDQGWSKQQAIDSAIRKAGFNGRITEDIRKALRVRRYRSEKVQSTWHDYVAWKQDLL
ncbi:related to AMME syndrome candidate gene 1 protein [Ustilago trichophora]|uniref:Related to AMME syndrome candidate gene 1 protein n=1 Tax=Ustilago trichophora TaxID=86804 RepID=A0A5C3EQC3_9BASI|nr:related to AMME syndrome candidate gene 1 protein [Ustilago trichophora]